MAQLRNEQKEVLDNKSQPIRQYLLDNLVPILTDGLLDICKRQPGDPVDSLAEYLFKRSLDVPYPDPTTYWETDYIASSFKLNYYGLYIKLARPNLSWSIFVNNKTNALSAFLSFSIFQSFGVAGCQPIWFN